jgi:hypothetical protein
VTKDKRRRYCIVNSGVNEASYLAGGCRRNKHHHIRWPELCELLATEDQIKPLAAEAALTKQPEPDYVFEWLIPWRVLRQRRGIPTRGRSAKFGEYLSREAAKGKRWAEVMILEIRRPKAVRRIRCPRAVRRIR